MSPRRILLFFIFILFFGDPVQADDPVHVWSKRFGEIGETNQRVTDVALDESGAVVFAGDFEGAVNFGGDILESAGGMDIFVTKFDRFGCHVWSYRFGDALNQPFSDSMGGLDVVVDGDGNIILAGSFEGAVDFGGGLLESAGGSDVFVAKFDAAGTHLWSACFGDSADQLGKAITCDSGGNVYLVGDFTGSLNFGGDTFNSESGWDWFDVKFDPAGSHVWSHASPGSDFERLTAEDVAIDSFGGPVIVGKHRWPGPCGLSPGNMAVRRLTSDGTDLGFFSIGHEFSSCDETQEEALAVATCSFVDFVIVGLWDSWWDAYVGRWDASWMCVWSHEYTYIVGRATGIAIDSAENTVTVGHLYEGGFNFGGGDLPGPGIFALKLDSSGNHLWSDTFPGDGHNCWDVAMNASGDFVIGGDFMSPVDFGGGQLMSAGGKDAFLAKFASTPTGIEEDPAYRSLGLAASPNPFSLSTTISFTLSEGAPVTLAIYDVQGKMVRTLVGNDNVGMGYQEKTWDGRDNGNNPVSSGVYFLKLTCGDCMLTKRLVLLK